MTTAPRVGTNAGTNNVYNVDIGTEELNAAYLQLPPFVRYWMEYEASVPYNPVELLEIKRSDPLSTWTYLLNHLKRESVKHHRAAFGGVHPQLDPPRTVW